MAQALLQLDLAVRSIDLMSELGRAGTVYDQQSMADSEHGLVIAAHHR
jgi:hypothetical protein